MTEEQKERVRANNRAYYYRNHDKQKKRVNAVYHRMVSTPEGREHMRQLQKRAGDRRRYGEYTRAFLLEKASNECENKACPGGGKRLHIHHIDNKGRRANAEGKKANNELSNLMVLCNLCHVRHHIQGIKIERK